MKKLFDTYVFYTTQTHIQKQDEDFILWENPYKSQVFFLINRILKMSLLSFQKMHSILF